jgi:hypothetical protein
MDAAADGSDGPAISGSRKIFSTIGFGNSLAP